METKNQDRISELVEKQKDTYTSMADEIWGYAEPRFRLADFQSGQILPVRRQRLLPSGEAESRSSRFLVSLTLFPAFSRRRTARSVIQSREKQMDMAAVTIFSERPLWRLSMR